MLEPSPFIRAMREYRPPSEGRRGKVRLDFNENTVGLPATALEAIKARLSAEILAAYPEYGPLRQRLASACGVREDQLVLCNGTDEGLNLVMQTFLGPGDTLGLIEPTYAMARFYGELVGAQTLGLTSTDEAVRGYRRRFQVSTDDLLRLASEARVLYLATPNNPTGAALPLEVIERVLRAAPRTCVIVDEAYFEFHGETALPFVEEHANLVVARTFSKAMALAGLRVGALLTQVENAAWLRKGQSPYSVNAIAAIAAEEALNHSEALKSHALQIRQERDRVMEEFEDMGVTHWESAGNFVLFQAGEQCDALLGAARESGVLIRDRRHDWPGCLRVTIGTQSQNERVLDLMRRMK